jgi:hypothetical protein
MFKCFKYAVITLLVLVISCKLVQPIPKEEIKLQNDSLGQFIFPIQTHINKICIAFIADHCIFTVRHGEDLHFSIEDLDSPDIAVIGTCAEPGLEFCEEEHKIGDSYTYVSIYGTNIISVVHSLVDFYSGIASRAVVPGESGTPVFCIQHHKVVGMISGYSTHDNNIAYIQKLSENYLLHCKPK